MRIRYDPEADILLLVLRDEPPVNAIEEPGGVIISYGEDGEAGWRPCAPGRIQGARPG